MNARRVGLTPAGAPAQPDEQVPQHGATDARPLKIYVASRASIPARAALWRDLRDRHGARIISSWIDEAGEGETEDFADLWARILGAVEVCDRLVLYVEAGDFPLKGALIEVGAALALGKAVWVIGLGVVLEERSCRPIGSWINHPRDERIVLDATANDVAQAVGLGCQDPAGLAVTRR